jgi:glycosyltransferase involved in cell wall biosynthesis
MSNKEPFFSIILPTRNNANYLKGAIETVVNQDFDDYELIVSNNFSDDNTEEVALSFQSDKIKYVKTDKTLYFDDSWNYALSHTSGKYILMIGDDDGVMKDGLKKLKKEIIEQNYPDLISQPIVRYYIDDNNVAFNQIGYREAKDSKNGFELSIKGVNIGIAVLHIIFKKEILKNNSLYSKPYPDYTGMLKLLYWSDSIYYSKIYVVIHGHTKKSAGGVFALKDIKKLRDISLQQQGMKDNVPLQLYFFSNGYYASIRTALKELNLDRDIDWFRYFSSYYSSLLSLKNYSDISYELKLFYEALAKQPLKIKLKTRVIVFLRHVKRILKKLIANKDIKETKTSISGESYGIQNIVDVSQKIDNNLIEIIKKDIEKQ